MKKSIIALLMILVLAATTVSADVSTEMSSGDLVEMAWVNSHQLEVDRINLDIAQVSYDEAIRDSLINDYEGGSRTSIISRFSLVFSGPITAETALRKAMYTLDYDKRLLENEIMDLLDEIAYKNMEIEYEIHYLEHLSDVRDQAAERYELGLISYLDYDAAQDNYETEQFLLEERRLEMRNLELDLELLIGDSLPTEFELPQILSVQIDTINLMAEDYYEAMKDDWGVLEAKQQSQIEKAEFEKTAEYYKETDKEYLEAYLDMRQAEMAYDDAANSFYISYVTDFNDYELVGAKVNLYQRYLQIEKDKTAVAEKKLELGLISQQEYQEQIVNERAVMLDYHEKILEFNRLMRKLALYGDFPMENYIAE